MTIIASDPVLASPGPVPHSFDTVCVVIPTTDFDLSSRFLPSRIVSCLNPDLSLRAEWMTHYFRQDGQFKDAPSWWSPPQIRIEGWNLVFTFSLPKLFYGHSARHASDLGLALQGLETYLRIDCDLGLASSWPDWQIRRLDLSYNFKFPTPDLAQTAEQQLSRLRYRGRLALRDRRRQYPYWPSTTQTVKFYLKGPEMRKHAKEAGYPEGWLEARKYTLDCLLRYEEEWRSRRLSRFCGVEKVTEVTAGQLLSKFASWPVEQHIDWVRSQFAARGPAVSIQDTLNRIRTGLRKPGAALRFAIRVLDEGLEAVRLSMAKRTYYDCCASLRRVGVEPAQLESHFDMRWSTPVEIAEWIAVEHLAHDFDGEDICSDPLYNRISAYARAFAGEFYALEG